MLAVYAEAGASVSAGALSLGLKNNLVHQRRRSRGYKAEWAATPEAATNRRRSSSHDVAVPPLVSATAVAKSADPQAIRADTKRGALSVTIDWPISVASIGVRSCRSARPS